MNQNEMIALTGQVDDLMSDLREGLVMELRRLRTERDSALDQLTKVSNELDLARRTGDMVLRAAYDSIKHGADVTEQRHEDELKAARAENDKLREAKNEAFRRLTNQNILLEKIRSLQEANLQLLRERDAASLTAKAHGEEAARLRSENERLQRELTAQEKTNDDLSKANLSLIPGWDEGQGPWVIYDADERIEDDPKGMMWGGSLGWGWAWDHPTPFQTKAAAQATITRFGAGNKDMRVVTLAEAEVIARNMEAGDE